MQYHYTFNIGHAAYTIVATRYSQARLYFKKFYTGGYTVTYKGRWDGAQVSNGKCVSVTRSL